MTPRSCLHTLIKRLLSRAIFFSFVYLSNGIIQKSRRFFHPSATFPSVSVLSCKSHFGVLIGKWPILGCKKMQPRSPSFQFPPSFFYQSVSFKDTRSSLFLYLNLFELLCLASTHFGCARPSLFRYSKLYSLSLLSFNSFFCKSSDLHFVGTDI